MIFDQAIYGLLAGTLSREQFLNELKNFPLAVSLVETADARTALATFTSGHNLCTAAFTSPAHMENVVSGGILATMTGQQLALQWPADHVLYLNPGSSDTERLMIPGAEVQRMATDGLNPMVQGGSQVNVGAPSSDLQPELVSVSADLVNHFTEIDTAYLFQMETPTRPAGLVLGLVLKPNTRTVEVLPRAAQWVTDHLPKELYVDLMPLSDALRASVAQLVPEIRAGS